MNKKSVQEVSKNSVNRFGKLDSRFWKERLFRNFYTRGGVRHEVPGWCVKIAHAGQRETLNLRTDNQAAAAAKAAEIYKTLLAGGWPAVLERWKPKPAEEAAAPATVGQFIQAAGAVSTARPGTVWSYATSLRRIVAEVAQVSKRDLGRVSKQGGQAAKAARWREKVDALPLALLTPEKVMAWRLETLKKAGDNLAAQRTAKTTINSVLRNAKALFAPKVIKHVSRALVLPPNPFADVGFFERNSARYNSKINSAELIEAARRELCGVPERLEEWKAFVLCMFAGLRKNEADKLRWLSVDFEAGALRIEDHAEFLPKCESSRGEVELDAEVVAMMREWRALDAKGGYVLRSPVLARVDANWRHYRAGRSFDALAAWLREKGVSARKPLHELRKEAGSVVAQKHGIYAASRFLRHADIGITSAHYVDKKQRVTVGLGGLLAKANPKPKGGARRAAAA